MKKYSLLRIWFSKPQVLSDPLTWKTSEVPNLAISVIHLIRIGLSPDDLGTYYCFVNNSVGLGGPCEIDIQVYEDGIDR